MHTSQTLVRSFGLRLGLDSGYCYQTRHMSGSIY